MTAHHHGSDARISAGLKRWWDAKGCHQPRIEVARARRRRMATLYAMGLSQGDIGQAFGVAPQRVSQILKKERIGMTAEVLEPPAAMITVDAFVRLVGGQKGRPMRVAEIAGRSARCEWIVYGVWQSDWFCVSGLRVADASKAEREMATEAPNA